MSPLAPPEMSRKRFRIPLRAFFLLIAVMAVLAWWLMLPTYNANRYVHAINSREFDVADQMCSDPATRFPGFFHPDGDYAMFRCRAQVEPLTWQNVWSGTRDITTDFNACSITATRSGIDVEIWWP